MFRVEPARLAGRLYWDMTGRDQKVNKGRDGHRASEKGTADSPEKLSVGPKLSVLNTNSFSYNGGDRKSKI